MSIMSVLEKAHAADPEGTALLIDEAVSSWMAEEADRYAAVAQTVIAKQVAAVTAVAKRQLARSYVECLAVDGAYPDDDVHKTAEWLAGIDAFTKAVLLEAEEVSKLGRRQETWYLADGSSVRRQVARDTGGRFTRYLDTKATANVMGVPDERDLSPQLTSGVVNRGKTRTWATTDPDQQTAANRHQAQWEQADRYARELAGAFTGNRKGVVLQLQILGSDGRQRPETIDLSAARNGLPPIQGLNALEDTILSVSVEGTDEASRAAAHRFNTMGAVGDTALSRLAGVSSGSWADALGRRDITTPGAEDFFTRMSGAAGVLAALPGQEKLANIAQLVGTMGPEAERVLGPHIRLAAYRYRGTEKTPDAALREQYGDPQRQVLRHLAYDDEPRTTDGRLLTPSEALRLALPGEQKRNGEMVHTPLTGSAKRRVELGADKDRLAMQVDADVAAAHLIHTLPERSITAELSERSGHVLPSQGVLLDAEGNLISQAVGYSDDHYLPFDLRNLARLRGGQYVRTRVQGGLTGEDIYAAVQSGARAVTVVSSSGVYSLELDPSFRGARGQSDKARSMYQRYLKILDAVEGSGMYLNDLTGPEKIQVKERVRMLQPGLNDTERRQAEEQALEEARRNKMALGKDKIDELQANALKQAQAELRGGGGSAQELARRTADLFEEALEAERAKNVQKLTLNAQGYKVALETLQQQFPYFIRGVSYESLPDFLANRDLRVTSGSLRSRTGGADRGYVRPGGLRPASTESGFYNPDSGQRAKGEGSSDTGPDVKTTEGSGTAPGGATGPTAAGGGTPRADGTPPAAPGGKAPLSRALANLSTMAETAATAEAGKLTTALAPLTKFGHDLAGQRWDEHKGKGNTATQAQVLLDQGGPELARIVRSDPSAVAALQDRAAVKQAFTQVYGLGLSTQMVDWTDDMRAAFGGATSPDQVADWVADQAQRIADAGSLTQPFVAPYPDPESQAFAVGKAPQEFDDLLAFDTPESFEALTQVGEPARLRALAKQLFGTTDRYASAGTTRDAVTASIDVLHKAYKTIPQLTALASKGDPEKVYSHANLARLAGVDAGALKTALGSELTFGGEPWGPAIQRRALDIQRAWTMHQAERSLQLLYGGPDGGPGDVHPKAGEGRFLVAKASSSRSVRVAKASSELALRIALARAAR